MNIPKLDTLLLGNSPEKWLLAFGSALAIYFVLILLRNLVSRRLQTFAERTQSKLDDMVVGVVQQTGSWFFLLTAVFGGSHAVAIGQWDHWIARLMTIGFFMQSGVWASALLSGSLLHWSQNGAQGTAPNTATIALRFLGRVLIWTLILLLILDNLGVKIVSLVAGMGIGGIAIALAVQNVLGDILSSVSIVLDKPFEIGDFIIVDDCMGSVEYVGLKTTRIRSLSGEQLILSNSDLLGSRIRNYKRMKERRVVLPVNVTYQTSREKLEMIPALFKELVEGQAKTRFERAHLKTLADFAVQFECVFWVLDPDMGLSMDIQQTIQLGLFDAFASRGIEFAYPTQTIQLHGASKISV